ncbi:diguanylate cyclase [Duganella sp. S19_KUP01_CR8]|uniref:diguanylate cyclase n=1 Tax=Duganella sp. S19_KUP01_CR8 TaxID=3025502 RepID=UPI002FCDD4BF
MLPLRLQPAALMRQIAIRYRLFGALILISLLPLLVTGYISWAESSKAIQQKSRLFATEIVKQVAKNLQLRMADIEAGSEALVLSDPVQAALARYAGDSPADQGRARADLTRILLANYGSFQDVDQKYFLTPDNQVLDPQVFAQLGQGVTDFSRAAASRKGRPYWGTLDLWDGQQSIAMARQIYFKSDNRLAGSLFLGMRTTRFSTIFDNVNLGAGSEIFILDLRAGRRLIQSNEGAGNAVAPALLKQIAAASQNGETTGHLAYTAIASGATRPSGYLAVYTPVARTNWYVVSTLPNDLLLAEAQTVRDDIVLIGVISFLCALLMGYGIARSISSPLEKLAGIMRETKPGNYALRMHDEGKDEIALLAQKFNEMAANIALSHEQLEQRVAERTRDLEQANLKLSALSMTDSLTGIANRRRFDEVLAAELSATLQRATQPLALLMIDVDYFKAYNDHYGHQAGDACLRQVTTMLHTHARRASDLAARYGGEEFVMLAADTDEDTALALAESIRATLEQMQLPHEGSPLGHIAVSVGVAVLPPGAAPSAESFIRAADQALYLAKKQGRNQVVLDRQ